MLILMVVIGFIILMIAMLVLSLKLKGHGNSSNVNNSLDMFRDSKSTITNDIISPFCNDINNMCK